MNEMMGCQPGDFVKSAEEVVREKMLREENKVLHARCVKALRRELSVLSHVPKEVIGIFRAANFSLYVPDSNVPGGSVFIGVYSMDMSKELLLVDYRNLRVDNYVPILDKCLEILSELLSREM